MPTRRSWTPPILRQLPRLTSLTLASAIGGGGGTTGGGSTVFGLLTSLSLGASLAVGLISGCSADRSMEPSAPAMPKAVSAISCTGSVSEKQLSCGGPQAVPGQEIVGGQGFEVVLRSSNVAYNSTTNELTFDVTLQNLSLQRLGWDGTTTTGEKVFFQSAPIADAGTVEVVGGGTPAFFTAPDQDYYFYFGLLEPRATSSPLTWHLHFIGGGDQFSFTVLVAADVFDAGGPLQWRPIEGADQRRYRDVVASSLTDWMVVGDGGMSAHFVGGKWVPLPSVVAENINAVTAIGPGEYLAATGFGAVLHFKNGIWTKLHGRGDKANLFGIWAKDLTEIVVVGVQGSVSRLSGGVWTDGFIATAGNGTLVAVSGNADGSLVTAINGKHQAPEVWTSAAGAPFALDPAFTFPVNADLRDVVYDAAGNALIAWFNFNTYSGVVTTSAGDDIWSGGDAEMPTALEVTGTGRVAVAFGDAGTYEGIISDVNYSSLPATVTPVTGLLTVNVGHMTPIDAGATNFLTTSPLTQHLYRWDGTLWSDEQGSSDWIDPDLWGVGDTVWALDGVGGFYKLVNGVLSPRTGRSGIKRLWGSSATSFFAIDTTDVWHSNGSGAWTHEFAVPGGNDNRDVWADPTGDAVIVLGENGHISSRILGSWSDQTIPRNLTAVWGCDAHTAWITTLEGDIYNWTDGVLSPNTTIGGTPNLHAITGNSCGDLWVVGDNGVMYHGDGASWTDRTPVGLSGWVTTALAIRGPGQVIGVGQSGVSGLWSVAIQFRATPLPTQGKNLNAIWRMSNGEVIVAGDNVLLRGVR